MVTIKKNGQYAVYNAQRLNFSGLENTEGNILEIIPHMLDDFIKSVFIKCGADIDNDRFCVELGYEDSKYADPMGMQHRDFDKFNGVSIFNLMGRIQQSNKEIDINDISITMYIHKHQLLGGGKSSNYLDEKLSMSCF